jgi:hypothetical protein
VGRVHGHFGIVTIEMLNGTGRVDVTNSFPPEKRVPVFNLAPVTAGKLVMDMLISLFFCLTCWKTISAKSVTVEQGWMT